MYVDFGTKTAAYTAHDRLPILHIVHNNHRSITSMPLINLTHLLETVLQASVVDTPLPILASIHFAAALAHPRDQRIANSVSSHRRCQSQE